jgi:hypothetical protein
MQSPTWYSAYKFFSLLNFIVSLIIDDIQEELRREDLMQRFKKAFPWIVSLFILILLCAAGYSWFKGRREQELVRYEHEYESALNSLSKKDVAGAKKTLEHIAKECKGLRFLALMTLADIKKNDLLLGNPRDHAIARSDLIHIDAQLCSFFPERQFHQFLSLCRLLLDAHCGIESAGPMPMAVPKGFEAILAKFKTKPSVMELDNAMSMYRATPEWAPLSMAVDIMKLSKGPAQQQAMQRWIGLFEKLLGSRGTLPLYALMGSVVDVHP